MNTEKLKVEFGQPQHGWLPIKIISGNFTLQFRASNIPLNPIDQLVYALCGIVQGTKTELWWNLEPARYYFEFKKIDQLYAFCIFFAEQDYNDKEFIYEIQGDFKIIILPFYRALQKFFARPFDKTHWPKTGEAEMNRLVQLVKK